MSDYVRKHLYISGRVQAVGFRAFILKKASKFNLTGWIKNLDDGRVEAVFSGKGKEIDRIIKLAEKGPIWASVEDVDIVDEEYQQEFNDFQVLY